jgi:ligand-binding SRPBCC domain-containing protein
MARVREEVTIAAPPEAVWGAVHEDLPNVQRWARYLRATLLDGPPGPGARVRYDLDLQGMRMRFVLHTTTWDRPRRCGGAVVDGPFTGTWSYTYARRRGGTHMVYEMDYEMRGLMRLTGGLVAGQYARGVREGLDMLREYVEAEQAGRS